MSREEIQNNVEIPQTHNPNKFDASCKLDPNFMACGFLSFPKENREFVSIRLFYTFAFLINYFPPGPPSGSLWGIDGLADLLQRHVAAVSR